MEDEPCITFPEIILHLVLLAQRGDELAVHHLWEHFEPLLRRVLAPYRRDPALYAELEGEVYYIFRRLILQFASQRGVNFFTYLARNLPSAVWSWVRRQRQAAWREVSLSSLPLATLDSPAAWQAVEQGVVDRLTLEEGLKALPARQREVFRLRTIEGYDYEEIAAQLGITAPTARCHFRDARANLRKFLQKISAGD